MYVCIYIHTTQHYMYVYHIVDTGWGDQPLQPTLITQMGSKHRIKHGDLRTQMVT